MNSVNKHGLSRYIPQDVKGAVRRRDGFGCVFCATPIVDYEHVDPLFVDAKEHNADAITLLCPTCHRMVTGGQISKELVKSAMRNPAAMKAGQVGHQIFFSDSHPTVVFGGGIFERCQVPLRVMDEDVISIDAEDGKYLISAKFWDSAGNQALTICKNEWIVTSENIWDFKVEGNRFYVQESAGKKAMVVRVENNQTLYIEHFEMLIKNSIRIKGNESEYYINNIRFRGNKMRGCTYGIFCR